MLRDLGGAFGRPLAKPFLARPLRRSARRAGRLPRRAGRRRRRVSAESSSDSRPARSGRSCRPCRTSRRSASRSSIPSKRSGSRVLRMARNRTGSRKAASTVCPSGVIGPRLAVDPITISCRRPRARRHSPRAAGARRRPSALRPPAPGKSASPGRSRHQIRWSRAPIRRAGTRRPGSVLFPCSAAALRSTSCRVAARMCVSVSWVIGSVIVKNWPGAESASAAES